MERKYFTPALILMNYFNVIKLKLLALCTRSFFNTVNSISVIISNAAKLNWFVVTSCIREDSTKE